MKQAQLLLFVLFSYLFLACLDDTPPWERAKNQTKSWSEMAHSATHPFVKPEDFPKLDLSSLLRSYSAGADAQRLTEALHRVRRQAASPWSSTWQVETKVLHGGSDTLFWIRSSVYRDSLCPTEKGGQSDLFAFNSAGHYLDDFKVDAWQWLGYQDSSVLLLLQQTDCQGRGSYLLLAQQQGHLINILDPLQTAGPLLLGNEKGQSLDLNFEDLNQDGWPDLVFRGLNREGLLLRREYLYHQGKEIFIPR